MPIGIDSLSSELGVTRAELMRCIHYLRRYSSAWRPEFVTDEFADVVRAQLPVLQARWEKQQRAREDRADRQLSTTEAAAELQVTAAQIRQWASRGYLQPVGRSGRSQLYRLGDLDRVKAQARVRTRRPPGGASELPRDLDKLVPTPIAAKIARVSPSTVRGWVQRGHLRPVGRHRRRLVFTIRDVIAAANRHQ